ncbi:MAG TPA: futalosine hydrolase [Mucilaginibacter sp.]|jgi:futalosine hydrolase|nr:futalosine hydrolase [Mucilaginibacter sp.]
MRILFVAATEAEIGKLIADLRFADYDCDQGTHISCELRDAYARHDISTLITGVGMVAAAYALGRHLASNQYDLAINLGIAGSFDRSIALGEVVEVTEDSFAELGAEDGEAFLTIDQLGFGESVFRPTYNLADSLGIKKVSAITVNTVHGNEANIQQLTSRLTPQLESMEGAAFFYACNQAGIPCVQIRAVSNYVEKRNRDAWQIGLAIKNLNTFAADLFTRKDSPLK